MPIIEQPRGDDEFYSPEMLRVVAATMCVASAATAAFGLWLTVDSGCFGGECGEGDDGWWLVMMIWIAAQLSISIVALGGLIYLLATARSHRAALTVAGLGIITTAVLVTLVVIGLL